MLEPEFSIPIELCVAPANSQQRNIRSCSFLRVISIILFTLTGFCCARAEVNGAKPKPVPAAAKPCPRGTAGGQVQQEPALYSSNGLLFAAFSFQTTLDSQGRTLFCFMTPGGMQDPVLHLYPGDTLVLTVTNNTPQGTGGMTLDPPNCGQKQMNNASVNVHFHGTNTAPICGGDEVVKTLINPGDTFQYVIKFPADEPPGMYWYHPHVHGISDPMVIGGATGALIIDGIESIQPAVRGLPQYTFVIRDQMPNGGRQEGSGPCTNGIPFRDLTINNIPIDSILAPEGQVTFIPAVLTVVPGQVQFWRVANTSADSILDLQVQFNGQARTMNIVAIDGVPVNSQDGLPPAGSPIPVTHFRLPTASRVEFIVTTPATAVSGALVTTSINTGAWGDCDPNRPIFQMTSSRNIPAANFSKASRPRKVDGRRFAELQSMPIFLDRTIYFSENNSSTNPEFYMTVDGQQPKVFNPNQPPSIVTTQGSVEHWTIQNRSRENHEFHIHQIHFLVLSQDNFGNGHPVAPAINGQYLDMVEVPAWDGASPAYPSVTVLMDFRGAVVGNFVFHCHILNHEDLGMMSIIQVKPAGSSKSKYPQPKTAKPPHKI